MDPAVLQAAEFVAAFATTAGAAVAVGSAEAAGSDAYGVVKRLLSRLTRAGIEPHSDANGLARDLEEGLKLGVLSREEIERLVALRASNVSIGSVHGQAVFTGQTNIGGPFIME